ncbi:thioredoxin-dependent thiol peroxidase [Ileibacterium valens]|uniref:thioredoxin-dependent thiol peroxidase n=1 Tax=Ileibacterium valens TaxID=1862668 RepID=UPI00272AC156|nr:thioredoxin-dependent thiol peroxidase [Ileibacterium valens]
MLEVGTPAPDFTLQDQNGNEVSLHDFKGKKVILYFYPKDNTAGCTKQACAYRDLYPQISQHGAVVLGISKDTVRSHKKFEEKFELPFTLLADPDRGVLNAYEVQKEKTMYGKKVMGTVRTTYLIDENGIIQDVQEKVRPEEDPQTWLEKIQKQENQ